AGQRPDRPARGPRGVAGGQHPRRLPGAHRPPPRAGEGVAGRRAGGRGQRGRHARPDAHAAGADLRGPGTARRLAVDHRGRLRHLDDLLDAPRRPDDRRRAAGRPRACDRHGLGGRRRDGRARRGPRGARDRGVLRRGRAGRGGDHRPADRLPAGHRRGDRAGVPRLPRRDHAEPRQVLHGHRRAAGVRGRRDPRLRRARPAGGPVPARSGHPRLRRQRRRPRGLLVRRAAQGHLQLLPADHRPRGRRVGALRGRRPDALPAPGVAQRARARPGRHRRRPGRL
ncbi:MAG: Ferrous iron transport permease EfeU, partial [uncultured Actinomycetospora sp.]